MRKFVLSKYSKLYNTFFYNINNNNNYNDINNNSNNNNDDHDNINLLF